MNVLDTSTFRIINEYCINRNIFEDDLVVNCSRQTMKPCLSCILLERTVLLSRVIPECGITHETSFIHIVTHE